MVLKATAKDPRDRYESAQEMKNDLDTSLDKNRGDEPVFVPDHGVNNDKTIILPAFNSVKKDDGNDDPPENPKPPADSDPQENPKKGSFLATLKNINGGGFL